MSTIYNRRRGAKANQKRTPMRTREQANAARLEKRKGLEVERWLGNA